MEKQLCDDLHPGIKENITIVESRYKCYNKYMASDGISNDREYCNLVTKNYEELYACLDKYKIDRKADYCNFYITDDSRYFGTNDEHSKCFSNPSSSKSLLGTP